MSGRAVDRSVQATVSGSEQIRAHRGPGPGAHGANAGAGAGAGAGNGVPWVVPALAPKRKSREASLRAERDYLRYALERLQAQVTLLESRTGCELAVLIQRYQRIGRRYGND